MRQEPHPISGDLYEEVGEGLVRVQKKDGTWGLFRIDGTWVEGEVTHADPMMVLYVGGKDLPPGYDVFYLRTPPTGPGSEAEVKPAPSKFGRNKIVGMYTPDPGVETDEGMRSAGWIDQDYFLENDRRPELLPDAYFLKSPMTGGPQKISTERYFKTEFHDLEVERLWKKTWQMACRADDIPEVGDYHVYEIANLSYLVVRTGEQAFKAHQNVCLHRGRILRDHSGKRAKEFRCPYHGWSWTLDGALKEITCEWDFPGVRADASRLPAAKVATWAGFVFINPDPDAEPLEDFLGPVMLAHYEKFKLQNRYKQAHAQRRIQANWKVALEAFMESYHVIATHPHFMLIGGDLANLRYDVFGNFGRAGHVSPPGSSPQRGIIASPEEALKIWHMGADSSREFLRGIIGDEVEQYSDAEINDQGSFNDLFPNLCPWGGFSRNVFRFRPVGDNPDECVMDVMLLAPWPEGKPKPPPPPTRLLGVDDPWTNAPELADLAKIMEQDVANMARVQAGLKAKQPPYVWLSAYQEGKIRNFHRNYDRALGLVESESD